MEELDARIVSLVAAHSGLGESVLNLGPGDSLWQAGMDSLATVRLMVAIEDEFDIEFDQSSLDRDSFDSMAAIVAAVREAK